MLFFKLFNSFMKDKKSAQEIQDDIFRNMSADEKMKLGADLWKLGRALNPNNANYGRNRSKETSHQSSPDS